MEMRLHRDFIPLLHPHFRLEDLENSSSIVFALWADLTIAYFNRAWTHFADENDGQPLVATRWGLGTPYLNAEAEPLRPFYERLLAESPLPGSTLHPTSHVYECSSANVFRKFSMLVYALGDRLGFVVINSLVVEHPRDANEPAVNASSVSEYSDARGLIVQCAHCRRLRSADDRCRWGRIPGWVVDLPRK